MRVALTKGTLQVPPTYFALTHAGAMPEHSWHAFTLAARISDPSVTIPLHEAAPGALSGRMPVRVASQAVGIGRMRRAIAAWGPDIIHQHQATWSVPAVGASRDTGAPLVVTLHGGDAYPRLGRGLGAAWNTRNRRASFEAADRLLAVSRHLADVALGAGADSTRLVVHYQGVDTSWWTPSSQCPGLADGHPGGAAPVPVSAQEPLVLFVGALTTLKGVEDLVEASTRVAVRRPHSLVLVGDGPLAPALGNSAPSHVSFTGALGRGEVRDWVRRAHVLALPTKPVRGRQEGAGLVLLEAQACGVPVIAYRTGGAPEMVAPGASLLARERSVRALASCLYEALSWSRREREERGAACRAWVERERSLVASVSQLASIYEAVAR